MIHEFIDYKKRTKNNGTNKGKTLRNSTETCNVDQSCGEWPPTTLVPPWLNQLGQKLKSNHINGVFDNKTEKLNPDIKNQNQYERDESEVRKSTVEESEKPSHVEGSQNVKDNVNKECEEQESSRKKPLEERQNRESKIPIMWSPKVVDVESSSTDSVISLLTSKRNFKTSETEISTKTPGDISTIKNDQTKKLKTPKKRYKIKRQSASGYASMLKKINVDSLLEERAKEILENYSKKKIHSAMSDIKRFEAKLLLLQTRISMGKLTPTDLLWLNNIRIQAGSKENFDKLMRHVREVNLKDILEAQKCFLKSKQATKGVEDMETHSKEEERILASTDDENNVKRFSQLLRKNQNEEEKRKCLEEVRNYFERKRRTRMTKCWALNGNSKDKGVDKNATERGSEGKEVIEEKNTNIRKAFSVRSPTNWKSKIMVNDAEVMGKAVDETLQKFAELYNFHVSPNVMSSMKNKVLKGIQPHSFEGDSSSTKQCDLPQEKKGDLFGTKPRKSTYNRDHHKQDSLSKDLKTYGLKERIQLGLQPNKINANTLENEGLKRLKCELENHINSASKDATRLKVQSIILEEESKDASGKKMEFIFSFTKNSLEQRKMNSMTNVITTLSLKDMEVQVSKTLSVKNTNTQTQNLVTVCEKYIQTEKNPQKSVNMQTENSCALELKKLKEFDVSTGLYRMVKSKEPGRFYLYPEKCDQSNNSLKSREEHSKSDTFKEEKFAPEKMEEIFENFKCNKKEKETENVSGGVIVDEGKKETDLINVPQKQENVWLWNGKKISSGADLKFHVESLLEEKLKEMNCGFTENDRHRINCNISTQSFAKAHRTCSRDNLQFTILDSGFPFRNDVGLRLKDEAQNFGDGSIETPSSREPATFTSEERLGKDLSRVSSEKAFLSLNLRTGKSQQSWKRTTKKKQKIKMKRKRHSKRNITDLKCLFSNKIKFEDSSIKDSMERTFDSGTTLESNTSFYSKNTNYDLLTLAFGLKDGLNCNNNNIRHLLPEKRLKMMVHEQVQTNNGKNSRIRNMTESEESNEKLENHTQWELIEKVLHRVHCKQRQSLWNDLRKLIKTKLGKDINSENAKEVCIQIEQDMHGNSEDKTKHSVLAKGYYGKNEGDVEVEIDLTLNDLEKIIRRRERNMRRRGFYFRRKGRSLKSSSQGQSKSNFASIQELRNILRSVSKPRSSPRPGDVRIIKRNKEN